tara:strand:- start:1183 stop:1902 length:720 start_codon:yes stop_codon:yes gene_type:complete
MQELDKKQEKRNRKLSNEVIIAMKNGLWIPICCFCYFLNTGDYLLSWYVFLKGFSANYYFNFNHLYRYPHLVKWKHMIKLTDSGHIANFLFYFYPKIFGGVSHNILFIISFAYYLCVYLFDMKDEDMINHRDIIEKWHFIHEKLNHILPYMFVAGNMLYSRFQNENTVCLFNNYSLMYTYIWLYTWFLFIYIPWYYYTGDSVYSVLSLKKPFKLRAGIVLAVNILAYVSNRIGYYIQCY